MIRKLWAKFDGLDVVCVCNNKDKKCKEDGCIEYVVKFTPVERVNRNSLAFSPKHLADRRRKLTSGLNRTANHIKKIIKKIK